MIHLNSAIGLFLNKELSNLHEEYHNIHLDHFFIKLILVDVAEISFTEAHVPLSLKLIYRTSGPKVTGTAIFIKDTLLLPDEASLLNIFTYK